MKREQLTNVTTESIDQRCAMLAGMAMALAYRVATFKPMGHFNDPQRVVAIANQIISLRSQQVTP
jgi:hypothetical protein